MANKPWRVAFESTMQGQQMVTTIAVLDAPTPVTGGGLSAGGVADNIDDWLGAKYASMVTVDGTLENIVVTELAVAPGGVPDSHVKSVNRAGARDNSGDQLPDGMVAWNSSKTGAAVRGAHGGWFSLPAVRRLNLTSDGIFDTGTTFWTTQDTFNSALLAGHDYGEDPTGGHLSYIIYSRSRFARSEANYYFDVTAITRSRRVHWLRSRDE